MAAGRIGGGGELHIQRAVQKRRNCSSVPILLSFMSITIAR
jgi:hypothetical protein